VSEIVIRAEGVEVRIELRRYERDEPQPEFDWVVGKVECQVRDEGCAIQAERPLSIPRHYLAAYASELEALHRSLDGEAVLDSLDPGVSLIVKLDKGRGQVSGEIPGPTGGTHGKVSFEAPLDQSYLPEAIAGLRELLARFPDRLGGA
jgi:hypothetical protein